MASEAKQNKKYRHRHRKNTKLLTQTSYGQCRENSMQKMWIKSDCVLIILNFGWPTAIYDAAIGVFSQNVVIFLRNAHIPLAAS